jgi:hypothetical protein
VALKSDVMELQDDLTLAYTIELNDAIVKDLRFLMIDYVAWMLISTYRSA